MERSADGSLIIEVAAFDVVVDEILIRKSKWAIHWGIEYNQVSLVILDGDAWSIYHSSLISRMEDTEYEAFKKTLERLTPSAEVELRRMRGSHRD